MSDTNGKNKKRTVKRYSKDERKDLMAKYAKMRKEGTKASEAASKLGVPYITLRTWQKKKETKSSKSKGGKKRAVARGTKAPKRKTSRGRFKAVAVVVTLPDGTTAKCATAKDAVEFLKGCK